MKRKLGSTLALAAIGLGALIPSNSFAQAAYTTTFQTSITYQNIGTAPATVQFDFYPENSGTPIPVTRQLNAGAGGSLFIGGLTELASFRSGSVVLSSDQKIVATGVQLPAASSLVKNVLLSNAATQGASRTLIATVLKNRFNSSTKFSVQNTGMVAANGTIKFFNADAGGAEIAAARQTITNLPAGASKLFDAGAIAALPNNFNGSATIEMTSSQVVAAAMELSTNGSAASAFESVDAGSTTLYMASALCNAFRSAAGAQNSFYAVQNTGTASTTVRVTYSNGKFEEKSIGPGAKASFIACDAQVGNGFSGSATITSSSQPIVAVGKVSGQGLSTAALGATSGAAKLAAPYVRWSATQYESGQRYRAFIAIQNVGANLPAGSVRVRYVDANGTTVGTHTIAAAIPSGGKVNSDPSQIGAAGAEFGYGNGVFGGSAIIEGPAGSQLTAIVRVAHKVSGTVYGEDYNAIPAQ